MTRAAGFLQSGLCINVKIRGGQGIGLWKNSCHFYPKRLRPGASAVIPKEPFRGTRYILLMTSSLYGKEARVDWA